MSTDKSKLGLWSGVGLCIASMVGSGIFLSSGYMAQTMSAGPILWAWAAGAALAMVGARAYAELAQHVPKNGGEYRYLTELMHPAVGYVAGWVTVIIGFAQPTAINALAAAAFLDTLVPVGHGRLVAATAIILIAAGHAQGQSSSKGFQNFLVLVKATLLVGFAVLGLVRGSHAWPSWTPPSGSTSTSAFVGSLFYIAYAFSGWNTAAYAAEEFAHPRRDVARAMLIGCAAVALFYMLVSWIFVANITPDEAAVVMSGEQTATLGHLITTRLAGQLGGEFMSLLAVVAFLSAMSAMLMIGPRITATMANDAVLPAALRARPDQLPRRALVLQVAVALLVLGLHSLSDALEAVGATLMLFSALSAGALVLAHLRGRLHRRASRVGLVCSALYALFASWMLYYGFRDQAQLVPWLGGVMALALAAYAITRRFLRTAEL
jgi:APA family basic amino acid/polyamine antiporter